MKLSRLIERVELHLSKRPTAIYTFRYEREDGEFREISTAAGEGRLRPARQAPALELCEQRLQQQYGNQPRVETVFDDDQGNWTERTVFDQPPRIRQVQPDGSVVVVERPDLHQDHYKLVSVRKVKL